MTYEKPQAQKRIKIVENFPGDERRLAPTQSLGNRLSPLAASTGKPAPLWSITGTASPTAPSRSWSTGRTHLYRPSVDTALIPLEGTGGFPPNGLPGWPSRNSQRHLGWAPQIRQTRETPAWNGTKWPNSLTGPRPSG